MIIQKIYWHLFALVKIIFYKLIYGAKFSFDSSSTFRNSFCIQIGDGKIIINKNIFFNNNCSLNSEDLINIGEGSIFGEGVKIYDHNHRYHDKDIPIKNQGYTHAPVIIGKHCWVASNVIILKGVTIGDNVTIGAGCIIYKDVPSNTVVINKQNLAYKML